MKRPIDVQLPLGGDVGAGNLVSDSHSAVMIQELLDENVLALIRFVWGLGPNAFGKRGDPRLKRSRIAQ